MSQHHPKIHRKQWKRTFETLQEEDGASIEMRVGDIELKVTEIDAKIDKVMDALARIEAGTDQLRRCGRHLS